MVERSKINQQLSAWNEKKNLDDVDDVGGAFGQCQLYKMLGYFSLIGPYILESYKLPNLRQLPLKILLGLLRLQTQLGDYHQALKAIENVSLDMKTSGTLYLYLACHKNLSHII